jgi:methylated-DNA-[protein]-cysteine S-methyltransferase
MNMNSQVKDSDMKYSLLNTTMGILTLVGDEAGLQFIGLPQGKGRVIPEDDWQRDDAAFADVRAQLNEYLAGARVAFDLRLNPRGTTFQQAVWAALRQIPFGETRTYSDIARAIGRPRAVRAVGAANGRNPLPIVVPCHRVVGSDGSLTGYAGGLEAKAHLLALERS